MLFRLTVLATAMLLGGCSLSQPSAESRYFGLDAPDLPASATPAKTILVGPITVADYLKRDARVTRTGPTTLQVGNLDHWVGNFEDQLQIALVKHLSALAQDTLFLRYPGLAQDDPGTRSLTLDVLRFDGQLGGEVRLEAHWAVLDAKGRSTVMGRFADSRPAGSDLASLTQAQSELLGAFAEQLAGRLGKR